jgi:hypothetical protein
MRPQSCKTILRMSPLVLPFFWLCFAHTAEAQWRQVASVRFAWVSPEHYSTFTLEEPSDFEGPPGGFTRLRIQTPGKPDFVLADNDGLVNFRKENCSFHFAFCNRTNLVNSDYVLFLPVPKTRPVLFVFGYAAASSPGSLHAVALGEDGSPYELFSETEFDLYDFADVDDDGLPEIVGKKCMSQGWGDDLLTYDPYSVYHLRKSHSRGTAEYSLELSKRYNLLHYYGWVGADCSEDYAVVLHPPGKKKPIIVKKQEAEKLSNRPQ